MPASSGATGLFLLLVAGVLGFFAIWAWRLGKGIRVRLWMLGLFAVIYVLFFLIVLAEVAQLPWGRVDAASAFLDLILFVVGLVPGFRYTRRTTTFEPAGSGGWIYRGGFALPAAWLGLFLLRYAVELILLGRVYLLTLTYTHTVSVPTYAAALILVDALFSASTGLVLGQVAGIWSAYRVRRGRKGAPAGTPPPGVARPSPPPDFGSRGG
jgi:hypothetical protein